VPETVTLKVAVAPAVTLALAGWLVMVGAVAAAFTVSVAVLDVAPPALLLTVTWKVLPLSEVAVAGVV